MIKKKIAFVIGSLTSGGAERVISNLSNELISKFDITIITFSYAEPFYKLDPRITVIPCLNTIKKPTSIFHSLRLNFILTKKIYSIFKQHKIDLAIGFITSANIITTIAAKLCNIPCVISERNNPLVEEVPKLWRILRKITYPKADTLILQTNGIKEIYNKKVNPHKIVILPNPLSSVMTSKRNNALKKEKLILTVGRLDKNKCHEDLVEAYKSLGIKDWNILIIGHGERKNELLNLINKHKLSKEIKIISEVKDIYNYYNRASIFVLTSKTEGFPNVLLEAMYFGLPSISYNCNFGPSDLIKDGVNGFLSPVNDIEALKEKLLMLMINRDLRTSFSLKAKESTEQFKTEFVISEWENLIETLINK